MAIVNFNIWDKAKNIIKSRINPQSYETWFSPVKLVNFSEEGVTLEAPNKFFKDWISEKYLKLIEDALEKCSNRKISVSFVLPTQSPAPNPPEMQARPKGPESPSKQIGLNPRYTFEDFVVGPSNRFAHAASLAVSDTPAKAYNPLFIYGGVGLGKTHLMQAMGNKIASLHKNLKVLYISSEQFTNQLISAIQKIGRAHV